MGLLGASLIYGDGVITPAISVLSAVEGVNVVTDALKPFVMPVAVGILIALFSAQRFGTEKIGRAFGPIMLTGQKAIASVVARLVRCSSSPVSWRSDSHGGTPSAMASSSPLPPMSKV